MAQAAAQLDPDNFSCCLCLELLKDPATTPCGHNCCKKCLQQHWDEEQERRVFSCPKCKRTFTPKPDLEMNTLLTSVVEALANFELQPADPCYAGAEDVACDVCTGRKVKALKFCLDCRASYCDSHLQPHRDAPSLKRHKLVEPSQQLQEQVCSRHDEVMKIYCRTDQRIICGLCSVEEHKGHDTVSAAAERAEKQRALDDTRQKIQQRIEHKEEDLKLLQKKMKFIDRPADEVLKNSKKFLTQIHQLEKRCKDVQQQVRSTQGAAVSEVKEIQEKLKQEMMELKRRDTELEKISHTRDHSLFLHRFSSLPALKPSPDTSSLEISPLRHLEAVAEAVTKLEDKVQQVLVETQTSFSSIVSNTDYLLPDPEIEPISRKDFLRYIRQITLDPNTVNKYLVLSEDNRKVTHMGRVQPYCDHPDRFTDWMQVLSKEGLTGRCYWEVKRGGEVMDVAVAYRNIRRAGESQECAFGSNDKSWSLYCYSSGYEFHHNNTSLDISGPQTFRVGVYLDHKAGLLSFYSVSRTMELLHRVQTSFTQPLYVGFYVFSGASAELMKCD